METLVLSESPSLVPLYVKALTGRKRGLKKGKLLPELEVRCDRLAVNPDKLRAYGEVTGLDCSKGLPLLYPYVMSMPVQMSLLCAKSFPLGAMGLVHVRNHVVQRRVVRPDEILSARCWIGRSRVANKGLEFDLNTAITIGNDRPWECVSTYLVRGRFGDAEEAPAESRLPDLENPPSAAEWRVANDMGRRYARATGDYNVIHISSLLAKLFGFPKAIIHGMWSAARALAALPAWDESAPTRYLAAFKGPILIGSPVTLKYAAEANEQRFEAFAKNNPRPCVCGLRARVDANYRLFE